MECGAFAPPDLAWTNYNPLDVSLNSSTLALPRPFDTSLKPPIHHHLCQTAKDEPVQEVETTETTVAAPESDDNESDDGDDEESLGEEQTDSLRIAIPKKVKKKPAEEPKYIFRRAFKRYLISNLPPTLVLHLKRFESSGRLRQMRKIEDHVDIPVEIDMAPYFVPKNKIEEEEENGSETGSEARKEEEVNGSKSKKYRLCGAAARITAEKAKSKSTIRVNGVELPDVPLAVMLAL
ncbi:hypothetical protein KI688_008142 [Linnemannia hyalina]|uniref:ubiquitinyl hydrolase 1 n=1 Tax=Linnemannia hyalina TaxID=64524 RepID=A0A9P7Y334_9FUNG|nr:hypothetical protein KI688_008142 [Linnemannia hyalina]